MHGVASESFCKEIQMPEITVSGKPLLRREVAALRLNISLRLLDELLATRQLTSVKIGKRRLITEEALAAFIRKSEKK
jgi:excisionase family DNA binding protein